MADDVRVKDEGRRSFAPHPEGGIVMQCLDVVDLGLKVDQYGDEDSARLVHKVALVFCSGKKNEQGELFEVSREFTVSLHEKAGLRQFLESWRGKRYSADQAKAGVALKTLVGQFGYTQIEHHTSAKDRTYAKIATIIPVPEGFPKVPVASYERQPFWAERKKEYALDARKHEAERKGSDDFDDFPEARDDEEDDLPF